MNNLTTPPAPLDNSVLHSPAVVRAHKAAQAAYHAAKHAEAIEKQKPVQKPKALTDDDYYLLAVAEDNRRKELQLAREVEEMARELAKAEFLASTPDIVQINEQNPAALMMALQHWMHKGYTVNLDDLRYFISGCYVVNLVKPAKLKGAK